MYHIPVIYLKDKQAFRKKGGILIFLGNAVNICSNLKKEGKKLIHIIDLDAQNGNKSNLDIYDALTHNLNVEVEGFRDRKSISFLLEIKARVVLPTNSQLELGEFEGQKKLLVARLTSTRIGKESLQYFGDVIVGKPNSNLLADLRKLKKRIILSEVDYQNFRDHDIFGILL